MNEECYLTPVEINSFAFQADLNSIENCLDPAPRIPYQYNLKIMFTVASHIPMHRAPKAAAGLGCSPGLWMTFEMKCETKRNPGVAIG
jgi:hypothetical protein